MIQSIVRTSAATALGVALSLGGSACSASAETEASDVDSQEAAVKGEVACVEDGPDCTEQVTTSYAGGSPHDVKGYHPRVRYRNDAPATGSPYCERRRFKTRAACHTDVRALTASKRPLCKPTASAISSACFEVVDGLNVAFPSSSWLYETFDWDRETACIVKLTDQKAFSNYPITWTGVSRLRCEAARANAQDKERRVPVCSGDCR
jgi:hypothetical protein